MLSTHYLHRAQWTICLLNKFRVYPEVQIDVFRKSGRRNGKETESYPLANQWGETHARRGISASMDRRIGVNHLQTLTVCLRSRTSEFWVGNVLVV